MGVGREAGAMNSVWRDQGRVSEPLLRRHSSAYSVKYDREKVTFELHPKSRKDQKGDSGQSQRKVQMVLIS